MNRASSATGWVRNPIMKSPELDPTQASSYELGWTTNPITGCLNGCEYCYARKLANGRLKQRYLANKRIAPFTKDLNYAQNCLNYGKHSGTSQYWMCQRCSEGLEKGCADFIIKDPFDPRFWEDRLGDIPLKPSKGIFVCDMSDLFGVGIPEDWTERVLNIIKGNPQHRFYLLTKQPQNLIKFSPFPESCYVGVTATDNLMFQLGLHHFDDVQCNIRFVSFEPLLGRIKDAHLVKGFNLVIIGAQTNPYKPPKIEWVEEIVRAADKAGIPVFLKDNLEPLLYQLSQSCVAWTGWGEQTRRKLRQEMPE